jgi:hypothetical protein
VQFRALMLEAATQIRLADRVRCRPCRRA